MEKVAVSRIVVMPESRIIRVSVDLLIVILEKVSLDGKWYLLPLT